MIRRQANLWLSHTQGMALAAVPILTAHSAFYVLAFAPTQFSIIFELRGIVVKLADVAFVALIVATGLHIAISRSYRGQLHDTGVLWLRRPAGWAISGLTLWMFIGVLWAEQPMLATYQAVMTAGLLVMALALADRVRQKFPAGITAAFAIAATFQAALTILQSWQGGSLGLRWLGEVPFTGTRGQGLTYNPNTIAGYLAVAHFMTVCWYRLAASAPMKRVTLLALLVINAGILATLSRGAIAAVWMGSAILMTLWQIQRHKTLLRLGGVLLAGVILMLAVVSLRFNREHHLSQRLFFAFPLTTAVIQESLFLGTGAGNLMIRADRIAASGRVSITEHLVYGQLQPAHNAYLTLWAELGLPGVLFVLVIGWQVVAGLLNVPDRTSLVIGCGLVAIGVIMASEFHFWLDIQWRRLLFWTFGLWLGCGLPGVPSSCSGIPGSIPPIPPRV